MGGTDTQRAADLLAELYEPLTSGAYYGRGDAICRKQKGALLIHTRAKSAELIKHASNAFLAMKISFINAVANVCEGVGAKARAQTRAGRRFLRKVRSALWNLCGRRVAVLGLAFKGGTVIDVY